jgi:phage major head subunit gpT-like protein
VDIINDDLGAFDDLRARLGRGAAQKLNNVVWSVFLNPSSSTYNGSSVAFWSSTRTNYITGSTTNLAADGVGLGLAVKAFRQMVSSAEDGAKRIGGRPEILLVPPELEQIADTLYRASNLRTVKASATRTRSRQQVPAGRLAVALRQQLHGLLHYGVVAAAVPVDRAADRGVFPERQPDAHHRGRGGRLRRAGHPVPRLPRLRR